MRIDIYIETATMFDSEPSYAYNVTANIMASAKERLNPIVLERVERDIERVIYEGVEKARIKEVKNG